ncbi:hypothetical protein [Dyadobacter sp. LHD-138]|uniref:hypothetical protein n=1 Tax=Dyadobacter sp. LHD-138 TaxID=3071413 RepID=UPI0027DFD387|nr:hypothetical protein [Dyadobacter sp. LHD-138]MDQ6477201.1 hypothetical protein [Dyadobacter sp. LHD-138]
MKIFIVCKPNSVMIPGNSIRPEAVNLFNDVLDAISDLIYCKVDMMIIESDIVSDHNQIRDLIAYVNKDVRVVFTSSPITVINA